MTSFHFRSFVNVWNVTFQVPRCSKVNPGNPTGMILPKDLSGSHCASEDYDGVVGMSVLEA